MMKKMGRPTRKEIASVIRISDENGAYYFFIDRKGNLKPVEDIKRNVKCENRYEKEIKQNLEQTASDDQLFILDNAITKPENPQSTQIDTNSKKFPSIYTLINKLAPPTPIVSCSKFDFTLSDYMLPMHKLLEI